MVCSELVRDTRSPLFSKVLKETKVEECDVHEQIQIRMRMNQSIFHFYLPWICFFWKLHNQVSSGSVVCKKIVLTDFGAFRPSKGGREQTHKQTNRQRLRKYIWVTLKSYLPHQEEHFKKYQIFTTLYGALFSLKYSAWKYNHLAI